VVNPVTAAITAVGPFLVRQWTDDHYSIRRPLGQTVSGWRDSNSRPLDPQSSALPSCATARWPCSTSISHERELYYEDASGQQR
jgi:hypothetical protein